MLHLSILINVNLWGKKQHDILKRTCNKVVHFLGNELISQLFSGNWRHVHVPAGSQLKVSLLNRIFHTNTTSLVKLFVFCRS